MEENYINIYSRYLSELGLTRQADLRRVYELMKIFAPYVETVRSRGELVLFIEGHLSDFPELETLKRRLLDPGHVFEAPAEETL